MALSDEIKIYLIEAYELLEQTEQDLLTLETEPSSQELINKVFRAVHTLKGNSGFLGFSNLESLLHSTEALLDKIRTGKVKLHNEIISLLLESLDHIRGDLSVIEATGAEGTKKRDAVLKKLSAY